MNQPITLSVVSVAAFDVKATGKNIGTVQEVPQDTKQSRLIVVKDMLDLIAKQSVHKVVTMEEPVLFLTFVDVILDGRGMTAKEQSVHVDVTMDYVQHLRLVHAV